jgi:hypothetical protein
MAEKAASRNMKIGTFVGLAVICMAALVGYYVWTGRIAGGQPLCEVCKRVMHPETSFRITAANGAIKATCCPRCGLTSVIKTGGKVLDAVDFSSRRRIAAVDAIYLEGSDIMECCSTTGFRADEGSYQEIDYDRCMPSLLAFARREDAEAVRQKHGGNIISFEEARQSVVRQLNTQQGR